MWIIASHLCSSLSEAVADSGAVCVDASAHKSKAGGVAGSEQQYPPAHLQMLLLLVCLVSWRAGLGCFCTAMPAGWVTLTGVLNVAAAGAVAVAAAAGQQLLLDVQQTGAGQGNVAAPTAGAATAAPMGRPPCCLRQS